MPHDICQQINHNSNTLPKSMEMVLHSTKWIKDRSQKMTLQQNKEVAEEFTMIFTYILATENKPRSEVFV